MFPRRVSPPFARTEIEHEMRRSVKKLKGHAGDGAGNGECSCSIESQPCRQYQHRAATGDPKKESGDESRPHDIAEPRRPVSLEREHKPHNSETQTQHNGQPPSPAISQAANDPA